MNLSLLDKNALVCGSSAGIGRAVAIELAQLGANVTLMARREGALQEVLALLDTSMGQQHQFLVQDLSYGPELEGDLSRNIAARGFHVLVNNTGGPPGGPIIEAGGEAFLDAYKHHLLINQLLAKAVLPAMKAAGYGRIINIISTSVKEPLDNLGVSNTTRAAVGSWAKTWANEVGPLGITVNNVLPGYTRTGRLDEIIQKRAAAAGKTEEEIADMFRAHVPARRFAAPEEIAAAAAFLATPAAAYINGVNLPVDGGRTRSL